MASPKEVVQWLPETLPEDFSEWDGESSSATGKSGGLGGAHAFGDTPKSPGPAEREAILASVLDRARDPLSASSAPRIFKQPKLTTALGDRLPDRAPQRPEASHTMNAVSVASTWSDVATEDGTRSAPELRATGLHEADTALFQSISSNDEVFEAQQAAKKKRMMIAAVSVGSILLLLLLMIPLFRHGTKSVAKQSVQPSLGTTNIQQSNTPKPLASEPLVQDKPQAQQTTDNQPTNEQEGAISSKAQARANMMNDQLTAPARISQDMKNQVADTAPPPANFGTAGLGGGVADDSVFRGGAQPIVKAAKPLAISAGIATGLLIQKTLPTYPAIAKAAKVSGTVILHATISKSGTITDLHVVSGPAMLQQPAVDAVRNWRYKPYKLNNEPTEVETTVNVIFSLGG